MNIVSIHAEQIQDSRKNPTLRVTVATEKSSGTFSVPSGASTGIHEVIAIEPEKAIGILDETLREQFVGMNVDNQQAIDTLLHSIDGTENFSHIGGNLALGISVASAVCAAQENTLEVYEYLRTLSEIKPSENSPLFFVNLINGGKHAEGGSPLQEHQIVPKTTDPEEALTISTAIQDELGYILRTRFNQEEIPLGDEGGFVFPVESLEQSFQLIQEAIDSKELTDEVALATDCAAQSFFVDGSYVLGDKKLTPNELLEFYKSLTQQFPSFLSFEDPFEEEDFSSFAALKSALPDHIIIGDDLTTTNTHRVTKAVAGKSINGLIIKPNQIGTLTDTLQTMKLAREHDIHCIVSHRSGETMDTFIADLAYAFGCYGLKAGAPQAPERNVKYQRLIDIYNHDHNR